MRRKSSCIQFTAQMAILVLFIEKKVTTTTKQRKEEKQIVSCNGQKGGGAGRFYFFFLFQNLWMVQQSTRRLRTRGRIHSSLSHTLTSVVKKDDSMTFKDRNLTGKKVRRFPIWKYDFSSGVVFITCEAEAH